uniref:Nickel transporter n=1 Tax=Archaeoglobus fulgidus TaxID=2234 RepID=A0A7J2TK49_ARCFL
MHIPDGYLDLNLAVAFFVLSISVLGYCMLKLRNEKLTALFGVVAGAIFVAQMLDWPIPGGTSAHYVGGALAAILLGPYAGAIAMTIVLTIQAIVFGDGGITAWGANVWNMAIANVFVSYYVYRALKKFGIHIASFFAGWIGITVAAILVGIEIGLSTSFAYGLAITVPVMGIWHAVLGIIEGIITASVVGYIAMRRAEVLEKKEVGKLSAAVIGILLALSPLFAYLSEEVGSSEPMDKAAEMLELEEANIYEGIFPDYSIPGIDPYVGALLSGIVGLLIVLALSLSLRYASASRKNP